MSETNFGYGEGAGYDAYDMYELNKPESFGTKCKEGIQYINAALEIDKKDILDDFSKKWDAICKACLNVK